MVLNQFANLWYHDKRLILSTKKTRIVKRIHATKSWWLIIFDTRLKWLKYLIKRTKRKKIKQNQFQNNINFSTKRLNAKQYIKYLRMSKSLFLTLWIRCCNSVTSREIDFVWNPNIFNFLTCHPLGFHFNLILSQVCTP